MRPHCVVFVGMIRVSERAPDGEEGRARGGARSGDRPSGAPLAAVRRPRSVGRSHPQKTLESRLPSDRFRKGVTLCFCLGVCKLIYNLVNSLFD